MTAPRMNVELAYTPQMIDCQGQFVVPASSATPNTQIVPSLMTMGPSGTSQLTPTETQSPIGCLFPVFCTPNASAAQPGTNPTMLPAGVVTSAQTAGSEFMIDCSAIRSDIISAQASIISGRGNQTLDAVVSAVDNVNKLVYVQVIAWGSGTATAAPAGSIITFQVAMKDTYGV